MEYCKKRGLETTRLDLEKDELPFEDGSFDNVISVHTLEHLEFPEKLIKDARRVAKKRVIILSPLGERLDPSHKQEFKELEDFKKCFGGEWEIKKIEESNSAIAMLDISKVKKAALIPFGRFIPPKPTMAGLTEAFSVEEIWNWAKDKFPLDVEEKLNGFRFIMEKKGDRVRLKTEGEKDRTKQLPKLAEALEKIPDDFIIDCSMGIERNGKALPRIRLMTLMADKPELEEGDVIKATMFDLPYWKEDLHKKPLSERRKSLEAFYNKYLKGDPHFGLTHYTIVKDRAELERQFRKLAELPQSEGILIKTLDGIWDTDGSAETWAKIKREAEIKVIALARHDVKGDLYNYTCGLLPGDSEFENLTEFRGEKYIDLGKCYNTKLKADPGDILTMGVEEIIPQDEKKLQWLGARVIDIDKDRKRPYFANQVIDIAERGGVLQKAVEAGIDYKVGDKGKGVLQLHIMGIEEDKIEALKKRSREAVRARHNPSMLKMLLKNTIGEQGAHIDLRFVKTGDDFFEGGEIMIGNLTGLDKVKKLDVGGKLRFGWKVPRVEEPEAETIRGPVSWMEAGKGRVEIFPPGEVGATAHKYGAMLLLDTFTWEAIEPQDKHAKKFEFKGNKFIPEGTYLMAYVPVGPGERVWMISKLKEEEAKKQRQMLNSPTFAYKAVYGKLPEEPLTGRTGSPKKNWKGLEVDVHLKDEWLKQLNSIDRIEVRSTDEGKSDERVAFVVFRMSDPGEDSKAEAVSEELGRTEGLYSLCDIGAGGRPRVAVAGKVMYGKSGWEEWWNGLAGKIQEALESIRKQTIFKIIKIDKTQQIVGGVIYEPHEVDTQGDYTDEKEIEKAMHRFMEKYATNTNRIRINHKGKKYFFPILECFQPEVDTVKGDQPLKKGSWWLQIHITNKTIWKAIEDGTLTGFSMGGRAKA
ncbi:DNA ligase [subsurface metagenome]